MSTCLLSNAHLIIMLVQGLVRAPSCCCGHAVLWCAVQALGLKPGKGSHMLYSNLSAAYLQLGLKSEALQAAHSSVQLAPKGFHMVRNHQRNSNHCNSTVTGGMVRADRI
jgi:hypothetical protein